jgi:uncharacterized protein (TIGR02996 family)
VKQRYECGTTPTNTKFFEIEELGELSFVTRWGPVGKPPTASEKKFPTRTAYEKEWRKQVNERIGRGYALVDGDSADPPPAATKAKPSSGKGHPELEAAILADLDDASAYQVYADALQAEDDPMGEFIALWIAKPRSKGPELRRVNARIAELTPQLLPPTVATAIEGYSLFLDWERGFVTMARYDHHYDHTQDESDGEILAALLDAPIGWLVRRILVGNVRSDENVDYQDVVDAIAGRPRPALRELDLGDYDAERCELDWGTVGNLQKLWKQTPGLTALHLRSGSTMKLGVLDLPRLETIFIETGGLSAENIRNLGKSKLPSLVSADLYLGSNRYGGDGSWKDLVEILDGKNLPKLTRLGLMNCGFIDDVCKKLHTSKILKRLRELDLSMGTMGEDGVAALVANAAAYRHLDQLSIDDNFLASEWKAQTKGLAKKVVFGDQKDDEYRYTTVGE